MTSKSLTPQIGRKLLAQLEEPKRESAIVLDGFNPFDAWDRQRITGFLKALQERGFVERDPSLGGVRTPGPWRLAPQGLKAATRGDFLASA